MDQYEVKVNNIQYIFIDMNKCTVTEENINVFVINRNKY